MISMTSSAGLQDNKEVQINNQAWLSTQKRVPLLAKHRNTDPHVTTLFATVFDFGELKLPWKCEVLQQVLPQHEEAVQESAVKFTWWLLQRGFENDGLPSKDRGSIPF